MLAYAGFIVQHITTGTTPLANLSAHLADPWGVPPPADAATVIIAAGVVDATTTAASAAATALKSPFKDDASVFCFPVTMVIHMHARRQQCRHKRAGAL